MNLRSKNYSNLIYFHFGLFYLIRIVLDSLIGNLQKPYSAVCSKFRKQNKTNNKQKQKVINCSQRIIRNKTNNEISNKTAVFK